VKLLFDQNLSHRLARSLADIFPNSDHVRSVGLGHADDDAVWQYAAAQGFIIVSKDSDFHQLSFLRGHPPKVVWLRRGNCSTDEIESLLRQHEVHLRAFEQDPDASFRKGGPAADQVQRRLQDIGQRCLEAVGAEPGHPLAAQKDARQ